MTNARAGLPGGGEGGQGTILLARLSRHLHGYMELENDLDLLLN